ncbi:tetratricopeptide repeat protein [Geofilum sp. OHC36d9]|uniref:tetratricopeptide repeat protein n=1 Tax=Geofilum sp. OHC36d9 TaxID=3458413 RepID=UPI0040331D8C
MKRTSMKFFGYLALATVVASCSSLDKMRTNSPDIEYTVTPEVLEAQGGKVEANIRVQIPGGYFDPKATLTATPVLVYEGGETPFPSYTVQGEKATGNNQVISKLNGGQVNYTNSVDYNKDMRVSDLVVRIKATRGTATADFEPVKIAEGVISTAEMVTAQGILGSIGADQFKRIVPISKTAEILYLIQQANIRRTELTKDEVKKLNEFIKEVKAAENKEFKGASISAYASPDGAVDLNTRLASRRETSAQKVLAGQLKKAKVDEAKEDNFFDLKSTPEDWEGFKALMEKSEIQDKDLILRVLSMYTDPEVREREIKNMSQTFEVIAKEILPQLRRSKMSVNVEEIGKSDEEISQLAGSNPADLTIEEILYAGTLTKDATEKEAIYKKAAAQYPNDWRTHNNVGYALYLQGNFSGAKVAFEKANSVKANQPEVMNNLGAVALQEGDIAKAEEYFGSAAGAGKELDNNLGVVALKKGQYEQAIRYFGNSTSCNAALARILNKDYAGATATLNANTMEVAQKYYLKAIVGARTNEANQVFSNLRKAVELDAAYKATAATDMEFAKYFEDATFKSTIQ